MIPRALTIQGQAYNIQYVNGRDLPKDCDGEVNHQLNRIRVYKRLAPSRRIEIILHEALHAMMTYQEFQEEEAVVTLLGEALVGFIQANPAFIRYALQVLDSKQS